MSAHLTDNEKKYMIEAIVRDMALMLIKEKSVSISEALNLIYNSATYTKLSDTHTELYTQSSIYVYDYLLDELRLGKIS